LVLVAFESGPRTELEVPPDRVYDTGFEVQLYGEKTKGRQVGVVWLPGAVCKTFLVGSGALV